MAETLSTISVVSFIAAGIFVVLAIAQWFLFNIPAVWGDLSGKNARKSIERMRKNNEKSGNKYYKSSKTNVERGKLTGTMEGAGKTDNYGNSDETGLLKENMATIREKDLKRYKELENEKNLIANENKILKDENMEIRAQLDSILYSRSYKITQKIKKIIKR